MNDNVTREELIKLLINLLALHFEEMEEIVDLSNGEHTRLFGGDGILDSLSLVSFIVSVEEALEDQYGISVILADEKAMSRRTSPFSRISYLIDYIFELIKEK
jgi:acyl carrier protein